VVYYNTFFDAKYLTTCTPETIRYLFRRGVDDTIKMLLNPSFVLPKDAKGHSGMVIAANGTYQSLAALGYSFASEATFLNAGSGVETKANYSLRAGRRRTSRPTDTRTVITNGDIASTDIASTIASWTSLSSSIAAAAGKAVTLTLSTPFDMTGFKVGSTIEIRTAQTAITIVGNAAVFDAGGEGGFFDVYPHVVLVMSNVTLQSGKGDYGGAIIIYSFGTATLTDCTFSGNIAYQGGGGAITVEGTATLTDCSFIGNTADAEGAISIHGSATLTDCTFSGNTAPGPGGALYFWSNSNGLLKNCSLLGTVSRKNNDIARLDTTANVTFACADGEVGTPVQMSGTEITKLPVPTCIASTIASWTSLSSSIAAAAGKAVTLTLSTPFDMTGFQHGSCIEVQTAQTAITIVGNGAVFDAGGKDRFFTVEQAAALVISNVALQNGFSYNGGAIRVYGTATLSNCIFSGNTAHGGSIFIDRPGTATLLNCVFSGNTAPNGGYGGAIFVGGTATLTDCTFSRNTASGAGGALNFDIHSNSLLKNCSILGTVSPKNNDIARADIATNVTFACADGEVGTPVQMSGTEITKLPALTCTIASWTSLSSSIAAAAGKAVTLTLSSPFGMTGFQSGSCINIQTAQTAITIVGNGAIFDAGGKDRFFSVYQAVALMMSNVTLQNGNSNGNSHPAGGAIYVESGGTITLSHCSFIGNTAGYDSGAISVHGTITLSHCSFSGNTAVGYGAAGAILVYHGTITLSHCSFSGNTAGYGGGALYFNSGSGLLKNCSLLGTVSPKNNDIARSDTTANVTFACADGKVGTPEQMSGTEITKIPALTCTASRYICHNPPGQCVTTLTGGVSYKDCIEVCT
jgi:predicted outer membrane repeat protein